jgi:hypothetical protein
VRARTTFDHDWGAAFSEAAPRFRFGKKNVNRQDAETPRGRGIKNTFWPQMKNQMHTDYSDFFL